MRKVITFLSASLCLAMAVPVLAQEPSHSDVPAPDMFKDVDMGHWAYAALNHMREVKILVGYPDEYFRGKRTLTRYEFAVALDRLFHKIGVGGKGATGERGETGPQGEKGATGEKGDQGPPGMTPEEVDTLRRLTKEFKDELAALGNNVAAINRRLDGLAKDVADIRDILSKMPKIWGRGYIGVRGNASKGEFVDHDGRFWGEGGGPFGEKNSQQDIFHIFDLGVNANIAGGAKLEAVLSTGNYHGYLGGNNSFSQISDANGTREVASETFLTKLAIMTPFNALGHGGGLVIGRQGLRLGHLTLMRPDTDTYFNVPGVDNGEYIFDGAKANTKLGSLGLDVFAGSFASVQTSSGNELNNPLAGTGGEDPYAVFFGNDKPVGQVGNHSELENFAGINLGLPIGQLQGGHLRVTAMDSSTDGKAGSGPFTNVWILGSGLDLKLADKINLMTEWGKTIGHNGRYGTAQPHEGNAFNANVGWSSGALSVNAGYKYIDPLFYAPGYWGRIGNWLNPTNIQGPTVRVGYNVNSTLGVNVGGDFLTAARNRADAGGLSTDDDIHRILAGLRWDVAKNFQTTVDWEGVYWSLSGAHSGIPGLGTGQSHPTEHYIRIGTGYNLTSGTVLRIGYEIGAYDGHSVLTNGNGSNVSNFNVFTSSVAVKF